MGNVLKIATEALMFLRMRTRDNTEIIAAGAFICAAGAMSTELGKEEFMDVCSQVWDKLEPAHKLQEAKTTEEIKVQATRILGDIRTFMDEQTQGEVKHYNKAGKLLETDAEILEAMMMEGGVTMVRDDGTRVQAAIEKCDGD